MKEKLIALFAFISKLKDMFDSCEICEGETVRVLKYVFSGGAMDVCEANTANEMSIIAHVHHKIWSAIIVASIQRSLPKNHELGCT